MRRLLTLVLVLTSGAGASAGFAGNLIHSHGGIIEVLSDGTSKVKEFVDYSMFPQMAADRAVYWVIGGCDVTTLDGDYVNNGKFKFLRGEAFEGNNGVALPNISARVNQMVIKEVPALAALASENGYFVQSDVQSTKKIRFGDTFHCEHYVAELDESLFDAAKSSEEREAIARAILTSRFRDRPQ